MQEIISTKIKKLKSEIEKFFENDEVSLDVAEPYFAQCIAETVRGLLLLCS